MWTPGGYRAELTVSARGMHVGEKVKEDMWVSQEFVSLVMVHR